MHPAHSWLYWHRPNFDLILLSLSPSFKVTDFICFLGPIDFPCLTVSYVFMLLLQINMYLLSRILFALSRLAVEKGFIPAPKQDPFPLFATLVWGIVLWLFEYYPHTLQPSLQSSMNYLYHDSNMWHDISDFLVYNKPRIAGS